MGCASSSAIPKLPDAYQLALVGANSCAPVVTTLRLRDRFWDPPTGENFVVCDTEWGHALFRIRGTTSSMKTLRDPRCNPLVHMKRELTASVPTYNVFDAKGSAAKLFSIKARPDLNVDFQHPISGQKCRIGLTGNWAKRQASIWMEQGRHGSRVTIGRVFRYFGSPGSVAATTRSSSLSNGQLNTHYFLAVMGGVDMALMVLICIALEQADSEKW
uniref:Tubby C-terminal domain-containing protein n=1 Tax=Hyaloperonospora arabidopsidis (strain Emoy2) TaxID=559515 RepID=M4BRI8_HYAAE